MKKINTIVAVCTLLNLAGCSILKVAPPVPKEAYVAVVTTPPVKDEHKIVLQILPMYSLLPTDKGNYQKIADAYDQSVTILGGELGECMVTLSGYQNPPKQ